MGIIHEYLHIFMLISLLILFRIRNLHINKKIHFMFSNSFSEIRAVNEIMWKNTVDLDRPQMT
jgi:hypothetical protein